MKYFVPALILALQLSTQPAKKLAANMNDTYAIRAARVYTLVGPPLEKAVVLIRAGKIEAVGADLAIPEDATVVEAAGLDVYPGFFDAATQLGLIEIESIAATVDTNEILPFNPQLQAASAINPQSEHIPVARANGITHALSGPSIGGGATIGGQAAVIHLAGRTIDEALIDRSAAMVLNWPGLDVGNRPFAEAKQEYEKKIEQIAELIEAARHYQQAIEKGTQPLRDLKLEALLPVVRGKQPLFVMANSSRAIRDAVEFCEKHRLKLIIGGGEQAWKVKDLLRDKQVPVVLRPTQSLPSHEDEPYDRSYTTPGELYAAGVKIAFSTFGSWIVRRLPQEAGQAVPFGLPREEAIKAITINPAEIFGLSDKLGTIEKGKVANLIVVEGDPLEIRSQVKYVFIDGKPVSLENRHTRFYEQFRKR
ncbi:MAG: amidohydrolase family protein [Acidobacteriota bacterium]|nr:amidohydrolase family protein [Blastocatellia bacterium]MDW8412376.1 amidohydrolase family protein [Acidobacteriota bacterium]